jgi:hypothetical protein
MIVLSSVQVPPKVGSGLLQISAGGGTPASITMARAL